MQNVAFFFVGIGILALVVLWGWQAPWGETIEGRGVWSFRDFFTASDIPLLIKIAAGIAAGAGGLGLIILKAIDK